MAAACELTVQSAVIQMPRHTLPTVALCLHGLLACGGGAQTLRTTPAHEDSSILSKKDHYQMAKAFASAVGTTAKATSRRPTKLFVSFHGEGYPAKNGDDYLEFEPRIQSILPKRFELVSLERSDAVLHVGVALRERPNNALLSFSIVPKAKGTRRRIENAKLSESEVYVSLSSEQEIKRSEHVIVSDEIEEDQTRLLGTPTRSRGQGAGGLPSAGATAQSKAVSPPATKSISIEIGSKRGIFDHVTEEDLRQLNDECSHEVGILDVSELNSFVANMDEHLAGVRNIVIPCSFVSSGHDFFISTSCVDSSSMWRGHDAQSCTIHVKTEVAYRLARFVIEGGTIHTTDMNYWIFNEIRAAAEILLDSRDGGVDKFPEVPGRSRPPAIVVTESQAGLLDGATVAVKTTGTHHFHPSLDHFSVHLDQEDWVWPEKILAGHTGAQGIRTWLYFDDERISKDRLPAMAEVVLGKGRLVHSAFHLGAQSDAGMASLSQVIHQFAGVRHQTSVAANSVRKETGKNVRSEGMHQGTLGKARRRCTGSARLMPAGVSREPSPWGDFLSQMDRATVPVSLSSDSSIPAIALPAMLARPSQRGRSTSVPVTRPSVTIDHRAKGPQFAVAAWSSGTMRLRVYDEYGVIYSSRMKDESPIVVELDREGDWKLVLEALDEQAEGSPYSIEFFGFGKEEQEHQPWMMTEAEAMEHSGDTTVERCKGLLEETKSAYFHIPFHRRYEVGLDASRIDASQGISDCVRLAGEHDMDIVIDGYASEDGVRHVNDALSDIRASSILFGLVTHLVTDGGFAVKRCVVQTRKRRISGTKACLRALVDGQPENRFPSQTSEMGPYIREASVVLEHEDVTITVRSRGKGQTSGGYVARRADVAVKIRPSEPQGSGGKSGGR